MIFEKLESIKRKELENGLTILYYEDPSFESYYFSYNVGYGGNYFKYINSQGKTIEHPVGIAHFLEHVMFNTQEGEAFNRFAEQLGSANAYTTTNRTSYLVASQENPLENLRILLDMVGELHINEDKVAKEKDIIAEEIGMYNKDPHWIQYHSNQRALFERFAYRYDILGSEEDVRSITLENLEQVYREFYIPNNSYLVLVGPKLDEVLTLAETELTDASRGEIPQLTDQSEEYFGDKTEEIIAQEVNGVYNAINYKYELSKILDRRYAANLNQSLDLVIESLWSNIDVRFNKLREENIINYTFSIEGFVEENFLIISVYFNNLDFDKINDILGSDFIKDVLGNYDVEKIDALANKKFGKDVKKFQTPRDLGEFIAREYNQSKYFQEDQIKLKNKDLNVGEIAELLTGNHAKITTRISNKML